MLSLTVMESKHSIIKSFQFAFDGFRTAFTKGRNFRIQIGILVLAIIAGFIFRVSFFEWLDIFLIAGLVLILELINTSLEAITDIVSPGLHPKAKVAKDVAAAAVLIASFFSLVIGALIFLPKLLALYLGN